jgi:hypothetical protein
MQTWTDFQLVQWKKDYTSTKCYILAIGNKLRQKTIQVK